ncbi:CBS domain protein [Paucimonas lemoignei]|uniref:CBS domain protein n=1 Tax=Paucimonas lemoignei TaxID=29443 RepID=A0A4R3HYF1_PAULE|nr:HD domain-containing phosphohydrolase [Paucimonas lemoignei]TCS37884.1 CBS domain protein [Paucimonas lemoignei]
MKMDQPIPELDGLDPHAPVASIMHAPDAMFAPETTLGEAITAMDRLQSSGLLIAKDGVMAGILTSHDLACAFRNGSGPDEPVSRFMSRQIISIIASASLEEAVQLMAMHGIRHLPVLDASEKLVGVISGKDFYRQSEAAIKARASHASKLEKALEDTLEAMAAVLEQRDPYTAGHQKHVGMLAVLIGRELGFAAERLHALNLAAIVHDLGKIQIPVEILTKPARLNEVEFALVKQHPLIGYQILKTIDFPWPIADIVVQHHEALDGSGYPYGLKGEQILPEARVLTVADIVESMAADRPYRAALGIDAAIAEITRLRGSKLDPEVVDACVRVLQRGEYSPHLLGLQQ